MAAPENIMITKDNAVEIIAQLALIKHELSNKTFSQYADVHTTRKEVFNRLNELQVMVLENIQLGNFTSYNTMNVIYSGLWDDFFTNSTNGVQ